MCHPGPFDYARKRLLIRTQGSCHMDFDMTSLGKRFQSLYGAAACGCVRAPGRVNLIGEHTDYNDGFVLPIAIEREVRALYRRRDDLIVNLSSQQSCDEPVSVDLSKAITPGSPKWANYPKGVMAGLVRKIDGLGGADILLDGDIPLGGGLSSSAALEVAAGAAILAASGKSDAVEPGDLAKICQMAEHEFAGAPCGIMDQSISVMGRSGHAMLMDCRNGSIEHIPFDNPDLVVLVADTQVKHDLSDGGYSARREQCFSAARKMGVASLRDADEMMIQNAQASGLLSDSEFMRAQHVVSEIFRTVEACEALRAGDYRRFGRLMYASHLSLRDDFAVSCAELDELVNIAASTKGVYGARMTGGGFGGCAIMLVESEHREAISSSLSQGFEKKFGRRCPIFATHAVAGVGTIECP